MITLQELETYKEMYIATAPNIPLRLIVEIEQLRAENKILEEELDRTQGCVLDACDRRNFAYEALREARKIVQGILGAPPPRAWKKWPNVYKKANDFLDGTIEWSD